jgi:hypothetical protein
MGISCGASSVLAQAQVSIIVWKTRWNTHIVKNSDLGAFGRVEQITTRRVVTDESYERSDQQR